MAESNLQPLPPTPPESAGFNAHRLARLGDAIRREVEAGRLPGAVIAIARRGKLAFFEAFGYLDRQSQIAMPRNAVFSIASMTKPLVSVGALSLYEEGRLMLNDPVSKYLPVLRELDRVQGATSDETTALGRPMTIQDLMRHTAGVTYGNRGSTAFYKQYPSSSDAVAEQVSGEAFVQNLARLPLHFEPGTKWDYGFGFDILGLAIEAITGRTLSAFLRDRLFAPVGMGDTGFIVAPSSVVRFAKGLPCDPLTGKPQTLRDSTRRNKFDCGGGCGVSTAGDYLRFAQMLLNRGELEGTRILARKTVDLMTADHIGPEVDTTRLREYPNLDGYGFGLGVAVRRRRGGATMSSPGEFHWAGSTGPYFWVDPSEQLAVVFMAHAPGAVRFYYRQLLHALVLQALE